MADEYRGYLEKIEAWVESKKQSYIKDLISLVNIKSVAEPGEGGCAMGTGCARALERALSLAESFGLETENDDYFCGSALYKGETDEEVAIVGHLDVVPEGDGWDYEPYNAVYVDTPLGGEVVGRGSSDNKGPTMAAMYALRCLRELGVPLKHTVRLLMGCQEEAGMTDMPHFLEKHAGRLPKLFLVCDCPFPIHYAEKGIMQLDLTRRIEGGNLVSLRGGLVSNSVPDKAEMEISGKSLQTVKTALYGEDVAEITGAGENVRIFATGKAGHAAFPQHGTDNAIQKLLGIMARSGLLEGEAEDAVKFLAGAISGYYGEGLGLASEDAISGRTTAVGSVIRFENGVLRQNVNVRYAVTADQQRLMQGVRRVCAENGFEAAIDNNKPMYMPLDAMGGLPLKLAEISTSLLGMGPLEPVVLAGGTHARKLPNAIGYGPGLGPELEMKRPPHIGAAHGVNESVDVDTMFRAIKIYAATFIRLDDML